MLRTTLLALGLAALTTATAGAPATVNWTVNQTGLRGPRQPGRSTNRE